MKTALIITGLVSALYSFFGDDLKQANLERVQNASTKQAN